MLKSHQNLLSPRPSDRLRVGDCIVDLSLREIVRDAAGSEPMRITVKAQGVLMALVAHAGKVVGREALLEWVWPDTMPNDDVVTQAITQLRKAFGDSRDQGVRDQSPREQNAYIETISKHGYRLVAPVEWILPVNIGTPVEGADAHTASSPAARSWRQWAPAVTVLLAMVLAATLWRYGVGLTPQAGPKMAASAVKMAWPDPALVFQRVASTPESEMTPSLSPDGTLMVYSRYQVKAHGASLVLQPSTALPPKRITEAIAGRVDTMPTWSPDGRQIAFVRNEFVAANEHRCVVMLISAIGSGERELAPCLAGSAHPINWYPDGSALVASNDYPAQRKDMGATAIHRLSLRTGRWEPIEYAKTATDVDRYPAVSPDGRWIAFHSNRGSGGLWKMPSTGGQPRLIVAMPETVKGLAWMPGSEHLVFSRRDLGESKPRRLSRIRIDGTGLADYILEKESILFPSVAVRSGAVSFEIEDTRTALKKIRVGQGARAHATAIPAYESSLSTLLPAVSPDGKQIVFVSDRSGSYALWWAELSRPESLRPLEGIKPAATHPVVWDETSTRILAIGETPGGNAIFEIQPRTGHTRRLSFPEAQPLYAAYHPDPKRLLVVSLRANGETRLAICDRDVEPCRVQVAIDGDVQSAVVDREGDRILYAGISKPEIWQADLSLRQPQLVGKLQEKVRNNTLFMATDGAWVLDSQADCTWYLRPIPRSTETDVRQALCLGRQMPKPLRGVSYDAHTGDLYIAVVDRTTLDIGLLAASGSTAGRR